MKSRKKVFLIFTLVIAIIVTFSINFQSFADSAEDRKKNEARMEFAKEAFAEWMENLKSEETEENRRILSYQIGGYGYSAPDENKIVSMDISFRVEPASEISEWKNDVVYRAYIKVAENENSEFEIKYLSDKPENWDKFLERYNEWEKENADKIEVNSVQGESEEKLVEPDEITTMSNVISIISASVFAIVVISVFFSIKRKIKK